MIKLITSVGNNLSVVLKRTMHVTIGAARLTKYLRHNIFIEIISLIINVKYIIYVTRKYVYTRYAFGVFGHYQFSIVEYSNLKLL